MLCKNNSDKLIKTLVSALPSGTVWVDVRSPSVVSGAGN